MEYAVMDITRNWEQVAKMITAIHILAGFPGQRFRQTPARTIMLEAANKGFKMHATPKI